MHLINYFICEDVEQHSSLTCQNKAGLKQQLVSDSLSKGEKYLQL